MAVGVSNQPPDVEHLEPMLQRIGASAGSLPTVMTMDAGYWSEDNAKASTDQGIDAYIAIGRLPHGQPPPPQRGPLPRDADAKTRMARKLRSKKGSCSGLPQSEALLTSDLCFGKSLHRAPWRRRSWLHVQLLLLPSAGQKTISSCCSNPPSAPSRWC